MLRKLLFGALIMLAVACKKEQEKGTQQLSPENVGAMNVPRTSSSAERIFPEGGVKAIASGPAAPKGAKEAQAAASISYAPLNFEPNAGVIWRDPTTWQTHLLALQLPHVSSTQVKWASLGTGWEGSEAMAMDDLYFYVVWKDAVYRVPKKQPYAWHPLIPNNGEDIKDIMSKKSGGGYMARGNLLYSFTSSGVVTGLYTQPGLIANTKMMAGYNAWGGGVRLSFVTYNDALWTMTHPTGLIEWHQPYYHNPGIFIRRMVGSNWTYKLYQSWEENGKRIYEEAENGQQRILGNYDFSWGAPLVVNGGALWAMGNSLMRIRTEPGIAQGVVTYRESGWDGVLEACADQSILIN